jgi:menaquinol-cytochrome c reductase iron-sulfur subunit
MTALCLAGAAAVIPACISMLYLLTPLIKRPDQNEEGDGFRYVGKIGGLKAGGPPQLFQVVGVKKDAWTTYPGTSLGAVFVRIQEDGKLLCLNARCTHLGCTVGYQPNRGSYLCPCHTASFTLEGERTNQVPPRNMDPLPVEVRNKDEIWVKFQNYRGGTDERIPV